MELNATTIAALATPPGRGGIAIVRISGPNAESVLKEVFQPSGSKNLWESHYMMYGKVHDRGVSIDEAMAVLMRAPRSYTREDVAELHVHGGEFLAQSVLKLLYSLGAIPAEPGEFTRRAFLNGRLDLSRAEAVMSIISAQGERASRAAMRQLEGGAFSFVHGMQSTLLDMLSGVVAALDYPEEIDEVATARQQASNARHLASDLRAACDERSARFLDEGMEVTIFGLPNVGKSSLFNALLLEDRAIVTDIPGTTRDVVCGSVIMGGIRVNLSDTAGIHDNSEVIEQIGVQRALGSMQQADLLLIVLDGANPLSREAYALLNQTEGRPRIILQSKKDLNAEKYLDNAILFSAHTGEGLDDVRGAIAKVANVSEESQLTLERHMVLARHASQALDDATDAFEHNEPLDLCAVHLHEALHVLGRITGDRVDDDLLDSVFSNFCVGK